MKFGNSAVMIVISISPRSQKVIATPQAAPLLTFVPPLRNPVAFNHNP